MKKHYNQIISFVMAAVLAASLVNVPVFAIDGDDNATEIIVENLVEQEGIADSLSVSDNSDITPDGANAEMSDAQTEDIDEEQPEIPEIINDIVEDTESTEVIINSDPIDADASDSNSYENDEDAPSSDIEIDEDETAKTQAKAKEMEDMGLGFIPMDVEVPLSVEEYDDYIPALMAGSYSLDDNSYDPREKDDFIMPTIRDQSPLGTCWAHTAMGLIELNLASKGTSMSSEDMSEFQLCYFGSHDWTDPLGNATRDNVYRIDTNGNRVGNWFDGGNMILAKYMMMNWLGSVSEKTEPATAYKKLMDYGLYKRGYNADTIRTYEQKYNISQLTESQIALNNSYAISKDGVHVQDITVLNMADQNIVKQMIIDRGGVGIAYYSDDSYYNSPTKADTNYYYPSNRTSNHAVIIVGWNDSFSKTKFKNQPANNGAWLVRNSWGADWGADGYFWLSYEDKSIRKDGYCVDVYKYDDKYFFDNNYQYDGGINQNALDSAKKTVKVANIFEAKSNETLRAVSFYTGANYDYIVEIYTNVQADSYPDTGTRCPDTEEGTMSFEGYHTVYLEKPVTLSAGKLFSVVVTLTSNNSNDADKNARIYVDYNYSNNFIESDTFATPKVSYYSLNNGSSWKDTSTLSKAANIRIKAYTDRAYDYSVTYDLDGGINNSSNPRNLIAGTTYTIQQPTKAGYEFTGWTVDSETTQQTTLSFIASKNIKLTAHWERITHSVTFDSKGGSTVESATVNEGDKLTKPTDPTKSENIFLGWYKDSDLNTEWDFAKDTVNGNITLYAKWASSVLTVTFNSVDGSAVEAKKVAPGSKVTKPTDPTKAGYTFSGWYKNSSYSTVWDFDMDTVSENITLYAKWTPITHIVTFDTKGGSPASIASKTVAEGAKVTQPANPVKTGYTFDGWYVESSYDDVSTAWKFNSDSVTEPTTLYAKWTPITYTIKFNSNGGSGSMSNLAMTYDVAENLTENSFTRDGYTFKGWRTSASGSGTLYSDKQSVKNLATTNNAVVTLYAQWESKSTSSKITISFNINTGSSSDANPASISVDPSGVYGTLPTVTRTGYIFAGWYTAPAGGVGVTATSGVISSYSHTLYAHWAGGPENEGGEGGSGENGEGGNGTGGENENGEGGNGNENGEVPPEVPNEGLDPASEYTYYTVTFEGNGATAGSTPDEGFMKGVKYPLNGNGFVRTGYKFKSWNTNKSGTGKSYKPGQSVKNLTTKEGKTVKLYAIWTPIKYNVSYNKNGGTGKLSASKSLKYGKKYTLKANTFKKTGYKFIGWGLEPESGTVYKNKASVKNLTANSGETVTLYAQWQLKSYSITYKLKGGVQNPENVYAYTVDDTFVLAEPERSGYTFAGWYKDSKYKKRVTGIPYGSTGNKTFYAKWVKN